jgi:uncharacterized protein (DUF362 family)
MNQDVTQSPADRSFDPRRMNRRELFEALLGAGAVAAGYGVLRTYLWQSEPAQVFIAPVSSYEQEIAARLLAGMKELGVLPETVRDKSILLKPNLVETQPGAIHICTHPAVIRGAIEAFFHLGAKRVIVAEGSGHSRDVYRVLEESGVAGILPERSTSFIDLNTAEVVEVPNRGGYTSLSTLILPAVLQQVDWVVSMPKMKTHHWAGVTLSMKNLFGIMPGLFYGFPKNVLHHQGIFPCILDINTTFRPHFAIVDGIVGMEGDGPIMGTPKPAGVLVMGRNLPAVDATCARIMGVDPLRIPYLAESSRNLGVIHDAQIIQRGEAVASVQSEFELLEKIPAHRGIRLPAVASAV